MKIHNEFHKLTHSAIVISLYVIVMFLTQKFAFGQYQIRMATSLYVLAAPYPYLVIPLGLANMLSNIFMGGLGVMDIIGGFIAGIFTAGTIALMKNITDKAWLLVIPVAIIPSFIVPIWLSYILKEPYLILVASLLIGQTIVAYTLGMLLLKIFRKRIRD